MKAAWCSGGDGRVKEQSVSKALPILDGRLVYRVKRLTAALRATVETALRDTGVSAPQHGTMLALAANPGASNATLARVSYVTPQTMNEIVQGLVSANLVERLEADDGRREIALQLTDEGKRLVAVGQKRIIEVEATALAPLSERERRTFLEHLDACAAALAAGQSKERPAQRAVKRRRK
jgi:DNA-binding MarR family transcriptional regulator